MSYNNATEDEIYNNAIQSVCYVFVFCYLFMLSRLVYVKFVIHVMFIRKPRQIYVSLAVILDQSWINRRTSNTSYVKIEGHRTQ